jgi:arylsulfatase A-like enzyme
MRLKLLAALLASVAAPAAAQEAKPRPNILVIVADDLGFSDLGAFGGEIATPNLDALANQGLRLTGFHTAPTCSPTRSMLLSGTDNHLAGLGNMAEMIAPNQIGKPGYQGYLPGDVVTLAERLRDLGYVTLMSGKWHLGTQIENDPSRRGFAQSFALLQGASNHYGNDVATEPAQGQSHVSREWQDARGAARGNFYSSDYFATRLVQYLDETRAAATATKPFLAYLTFTAPHWPLQAPKADIERYRGRYDAGFEVLRERRLKRQVELGLIDRKTAAHPPVLKKGWADLTAEEKRTAARDMEIYAAMVDRLDKNVGRVVAELKRTGEYDNTVILFLADNGAEGLDITHSEMVGINKLDDGADNSFDNRGAGSSYIAYGPGWAQAATAPSYLYKAYATEGGTRAVSFLGYGGFKRSGSIATAFLSVADVVPTFLELAGVPDHKGSFNGRAVEPIRGKSWVSYLNRSVDRVYGANDAVGTELFGSRAIRQGDWKITDTGTGAWQLFNIAQDPGETRDLASAEPARLAALTAEWDKYAQDVGVVIPNVRIYQP